MRLVEILVSAFVVLSSPLLLENPCEAQGVSVLNPSFEEGTGGPDGWTLSGGVGEWIVDAAEGRHAVAVASRTLGKESYPGSFQVSSYTYAATLAKAPGDLVGSSQFASISGTDLRLRATIDSLGDGVPKGYNRLVARVENLSGKEIQAGPGLALTPKGGQ